MLPAAFLAVTLTQLSAFLAVVRNGSVTAAAEELVVTQPSVSAAVAALERELGVELTERAGRSIKPTPAGEAYARYAGDVVGLRLAVLDADQRGEPAGASGPPRPGRRMRAMPVTSSGCSRRAPRSPARSPGASGAGSGSRR